MDKHYYCFMSLVVTAIHSSSSGSVSKSTGSKTKVAFVVFSIAEILVLLLSSIAPPNYSGFSVEHHQHKRYNRPYKWLNSILDLISRESQRIFVYEECLLLNVLNIEKNVSLGQNKRNCKKIFSFFLILPYFRLCAAHFRQISHRFCKFERYFVHKPCDRIGTILSM